MSLLPVPPAPRPASRLTKLTMAAAAWSAVFGCWSLVAATPPAPVPAPGCALWFLGSSSINRWTTLAADMHPWAAHNFGIDGATIRDVGAHYPAHGTPRAIVLYGGDNDIAFGMEPEAALADLRALLAAHPRAAGVPVLLLSVKPSPARWAQRRRQIAFNAGLRALAAHDRSIRYVEVGPQMLRGGRPGPYYVADGVHMNAAGYHIWRNAVTDALARALPRAAVRACTAPGAAAPPAA